MSRKVSATFLMVAIIMVAIFDARPAAADASEFSDCGTSLSCCSDHAENCRAKCDQAYYDEIGPTCAGAAAACLCNLFAPNAGCAALCFVGLGVCLFKHGVAITKRSSCRAEADDLWQDCVNDIIMQCV